MKVEVAEFDSGRSFVTITGNLTGETAAQLHMAIARTIKNGQNYVLLDLAQVSKFEDDALDSLATVSQFIKSMNGYFRILNTEAIVSEMFAVRPKARLGLVA